MELDTGAAVSIISTKTKAKLFPEEPDNIFATLAEGKWFSKIDLRHAHQQLNLAESSHPYVTVNTHRRL